MYILMYNCMYNKSRYFTLRNRYYTFIQSKNLKYFDIFVEKCELKYKMFKYVW